MKKLLSVFFVSVLLIMTACDNDNPTEPLPENNEIVTGNIKVAPAYFSITKKTNVTPFDLKFLNEGRTVGVYLNGGVSGSAGVTAKNLGIVDFNAAANTDSGFVADADGAYIIGENWYIYDPINHTLSSKGEVYLIKATDYKIYKMKIEAFAAGYTIRYTLTDADGKPTEIKTATIPATAGAPGLYCFSTNALIYQDEWDVAFLTIPLFVPELGASVLMPGMRIDSAAGVELAIVEDKTYDEITSLPSGLTFKKDEGDNLAVGDDLFEYNPENHRLTPPDIVYIFKTIDGKHAKLKVTSYYHPETGDSGYVNFKVELLS